MSNRENDVADLDEVNSAIQAAATAAEDTQKWTTFHLNGELYAIDVMSVKEVLKYTETTDVPGAHKEVLGILNLRGQIVTVIDTRELVKTDSKEADDDDYIIVMEMEDGEYVGFLVDKVEHVIDINPNSISEKPKSSEGESKSDFIQGVVYLDNELVIVVDVKALLTKVKDDSIAMLP